MYCYVSNSLQLATFMSSFQYIARPGAAVYVSQSDLGEGVAAPGNEVFVANLNLQLARYEPGVAAFAKSVGVSQSTVSLWRSGKREPNLETIGRIARVFGIPMIELFVDPSDPASIGLSADEALRVLKLLVEKAKG